MLTMLADGAKHRLMMLRMLAARVILMMLAAPLIWELNGAKLRSMLMMLAARVMLMMLAAPVI